ncbi:PHP domain-containing protein [Kribbella albertanoniae]|uniref:Histidinol-phosphatase n=1 Tax=Kribbella albertanoniae TaxID=1266829 RepID=A0A4R4NY39_9ACTN|nr:PHP domain-containing protein [Kribbella albertanoniae]TDC14798.1 PHP domain-containing protein [Kribbella albertanoniae]
MLPPDSHVHSQCSWDAPDGSMEATCARAVELGLPAIVFTDHADFTRWHVSPGTDLPAAWRHLVTHEVLTPPALDLPSYRIRLERCRQLFPSLRIRSGVELSDPHWHPGPVADLLRATEFDLVIAAVHSMRTPAGVGEVSLAYEYLPAADVIREYLAETLRMIERYDGFDVLAHIDYPARYWPGDPFDPTVFEDEYRTVLRALAGAGKALELNTKLPMDAEILRWWRAEGGRTITFASDAHSPSALAHGFPAAVALAEAAGFAPVRTPYDLWTRR